ncbi:hypothetical protein J7E97_23640 [Streptomyces sp. ISL-66]|uniref:hypothetical protein n=1 Tax=Streptomyces sp. ISL-66 TaxID=2819186 RepID=UPI001BEB9111|nr:hypothetical protein [Streptomyces sp. ISL-66]MBT2470776.1 hypothetical protein [Streptomyces sp. ISL-66]
MKLVGKATPDRIKKAAVLAWREPLSRVYVVLLAVCALWAMVGGAGLGEHGWLVRAVAVVLTMPWFLLVHLFLLITQVNSWLLGYDFYSASPGWLFEPLWVLYCATTGLLTARLLARWSRAARRAGTAPWVVPAVVFTFFAAVFAVWHA